MTQKTTTCMLLLVLAMMGACNKTTSLDTQAADSNVTDNAQTDAQSATLTAEELEQQRLQAEQEELEQQRLQAEQEELEQQRRLQAEQRAKERAEALKHASSGFVPALCLPKLSENDAAEWSCDPYANRWLCTKQSCKLNDKSYVQGVHIDPAGSSETPVVMCGDQPVDENARKCRPLITTGLSKTCLLDVFVPQYARLEDGKVYCGKSPAPSDDLTGYHCAQIHGNMVWICDGYACMCGDTQIAHGTRCIDGVPACKGLRVQTPIPGFGCDGDEYRCGLWSGCDLGNGTVCNLKTANASVNRIMVLNAAMIFAAWGRHAKRENASVAEIIITIRITALISVLLQSVQAWGTLGVVAGIVVEPVESVHNTIITATILMVA